MTGTDANNCQNTDVITITVNNLPTVIANASSTSICTGSPVTLSGSGTAVSYSWTNSVTDGVAFNPTSTQTYTVTGTDANNCQSTDAITVTVNSLPTVVANATSTSVCLGSSVTLTGNGATSYTWTNSVTDGMPFNPTGTQSYTVTGTDVNGCQNTDNITVSVNGLPTVIANASATTICDGSPVTLTGSGAIAYTWTNSVSDGVAFNPTSTQSYTVTGTDANNCQNTDNITVTVNPSPSFTITSNDPTTCLGTDGDIVLSGLSNTTSYQLTYTGNSTVGPNAVTSDGSGQITITGLTAGTYTNFIVDLNSCSTTDNSSIILTDPTPPSISSVNVTDEACSSANGAIEIIATGGNPTIQYSIDNGVNYGNSNTFTNLSNGTYDISIIDANSCTTSSQVMINNIAGPTINALNIVDISCFGANDGSITVDATGNSTLTYAENGNAAQASNVFNNLANGNYTITVTDANGCITTQMGIINEPTQLVDTATFTNPICGNANGDIMISTQGGTPPYSFAWQHDANLTNDTISNLSNGQYIVTIQDANACTLIDTITLSGSTAVVIETTFTNESCEGESDGKAEVTNVTGGTPTYSYSWDTGSNSASITDLSANIYQVTVTDTDGCFDVKTIIIDVDSDECLNIHNAISPNNDGDNDTWVITGIKGKPDATVQIFNRWGTLIYESSDYQNDWRGTYKGKDLPAGVYYYIVTISADEAYEGAITILR